MSLHADERETTVTSTDADDVVLIWTAQRRHIGKLRRHPSFKEVRSGFSDGLLLPLASRRRGQPDEL